MNSGPTLFAAANMALGAITAAIIGGGLVVFFGTIVQALWRLRNRPEDVDPRDAIGAGRTILLMLIGLWLAAAGVAWRIYADSSAAESNPADNQPAVTSPRETHPSSVPSDPSGTDR
jgi:hypothetical protein